MALVGQVFVIQPEGISSADPCEPTVWSSDTEGGFSALSSISLLNRTGSFLLS